MTEPSSGLSLTLNPINVPAMSVGDKPVLSQTAAITKINGLASFTKASVNLPGTYTLFASMRIDGELISVTCAMFTIAANPATSTGESALMTYA